MSALRIKSCSLSDETPVPDTISDCPSRILHTPAPRGYIGWHEWAEKMTRTHSQQRCPGCGLLKVWKLKRRQPPKSKCRKCGRDTRTGRPGRPPAICDACSAPRETETPK